LTALSGLLPKRLLSHPPKVLLKFLLKDGEADVKPYDDVRQVISSMSAELIRS